MLSNELEPFRDVPDNNRIINRTLVTKVTYARDTWRKLLLLRVEDVNAWLSFVTAVFPIEQENT
jgi:hypothetical protein